VTLLRNHPDQRVAKAKLIEELLATGWGHFSSSSPLTKQESEEQIAYCLRKGYFVEEDVIDEASGNTEKLLKTTPKVDEVWLFISKLATHVRRTVASEPRAVGQVDESDPKVG